MTLDLINNWRVHQNVVLALFINTWYTKSEEERKALPVSLHVGKSGNPSRIEDEKGTVICTYSIIESQPYVHWVRSLEDLDRIDEIGHDNEANREYVDHGNDGRVETAEREGG